MKLDVKWVIGSIARFVLMGPLMLVRSACDKAIAWLSHNLPGG